MPRATAATAASALLTIENTSLEFTSGRQLSPWRGSSKHRYRGAEPVVSAEFFQVSRYR